MWLNGNKVVKAVSTVPSSFLADGNQSLIPKLVKMCPSLTNNTKYTTLIIRDWFLKNRT